MKTVEEVGVFRRQARKLVGELSFSSKATLQPSISSYSVGFVTQKDAKILTGNTDQLNCFCYWFLKYSVSTATVSADVCNEYIKGCPVLLYKPKKRL